MSIDSAAARSSAKCGLFGGSFDPVHEAHLALGRLAIERLGLDELRWLPAGDAWQKQRPLSPAADRLAMLELALAGDPRSVIDRREIDRPGPSYTIDSVIELQAERPGTEWYLVLGQDQYRNLPTWHRWEELIGRVVLAVAAREGLAVDAPPALAARAHRCVVLPLPTMPISATAVRASAAAGRGLDAMVPAPVARYIDLHHLYARTA